MQLVCLARPTHNHACAPDFGIERRALCAVSRAARFVRFLYRQRFRAGWREGDVSGGYEHERNLRSPPPTPQPAGACPPACSSALTLTSTSEWAGENASPPSGLASSLCTT